MAVIYHTKTTKIVITSNEKPIITLTPQSDVNDPQEKPLLKKRGRKPKTNT